jgi:hypothetical protein
MILRPKTLHTTVWKASFQFKAIGELFGEKSLWEDLRKTSVSSLKDDPIFVLTFPKYKKHPYFRVLK